MSFSQRLKALGVEHQMTQLMLAERMNVARTTITGYETKNRQPSHEKLKDLADIFDVTVDYLIDSKEDNEPTYSLTAQHENIVDQKVVKLYKQLTLKSKEEVLKFLHYLELYEKEQKELKK